MPAIANTKFNRNSIAIGLSLLFISEYPALILPVRISSSIVVEMVDTTNTSENYTRGNAAAAWVKIL